MKYSVKSNVDSVNNVKLHHSQCKEIVGDDDETLRIGSSSESGDDESIDSDTLEMSNSGGEECTNNEAEKSDIHKEKHNDITFNSNKHDFECNKDSNIRYETNPDEESDSYKEEMNGITCNVNKHDSELETYSDEESSFLIEERHIMNVDVSKHDCDNDKSYNFKHETTSDEDSFSDVDSSKNRHELSLSKDIQITDLDKKKVDYSKNRSNTKDKKIAQMTVDGEMRKYKCCMCNKKFKMKHHLNQHILIHTDVREKLPKPHKCPTCSKAFKMKHHLERHVLTHTKEKQFKCSYCDKSYVANHDLKLHISKKHFINKSQLNGNICNEKLSTNSKLEKPLVASDLTCDICGKVFSARKYLIYHVRTHLKMTSFICDICGKAFRFNSSLVEHTRSHTNERPYECDICNKTFSTKFNQNRHKKSHFQKEHCNSCNRSFSDKGKFQSHVKICNLKKRCDKCGWEFKKMSNYKRHLIVHLNYYSKSDVLKNDKDINYF